MSNNQPKFKIGIVDGLCLAIAIAFLIVLIAGAVIYGVGGNQGTTAGSAATPTILMLVGGIGAAIFILIFLIYEIVAVVKMKKARNVLMLGAAPEQKRAPKALGAGGNSAFGNRTNPSMMRQPQQPQPQPQRQQNALTITPSKIEVNQKWTSNISQEEIKQAEQQVFTVVSSKESKEIQSAAPNKEITIMISLERNEVESVIKGGKSVLFFKTLPIQDVKKVIVFLKKDKGWPGGVIGQFNLSEKKRMAKHQAWEVYGRDSTLSQEEFNKYYKGESTVNLIKIGNLVQYQQPKPLSAYGAKRPPIVFFYLK